jgi:hypothetical protein
MNLTLLRKEVHGIDFLGNCSAWIHFSFSTLRSLQGAGLHVLHRSFHRHRSSDETAFVLKAACKSTPLRSSYQDLSDRLFNSSLVHFTSSCGGDYVTMHLGTYQSRLFAKKKHISHVSEEMFGSVCSAHDVCRSTKKWF